MSREVGADEDFVENCYQKILGREADSSGKKHFVELLRRGAPRHVIMTDLLDSDEYKRRMSSCDSPFIAFAPPGHFYSPLPEYDSIERSYNAKMSPEILGIDLNETEQIMNLKLFSKFYSKLPWGDGYRKSNTRYYFSGDDWYSYGDAIILFSVINTYEPKRFIEIGSGYSSLVALDTCELFLENKTEISFIEPYPDRLLGLLSPIDDPSKLLLRECVQDVGLELFEELDKKDILFVDSSHVVKFSSDVLFIISEVLPRLQPGVIIHFHDVFWPFEYPLEWLHSGRAWNEAYFLRAFLMNNNKYKIIYFNDFMVRRHHTLLKRCMPLAIKNPGCGIWIQKVK